MAGMAWNVYEQVAAGRIKFLRFAGGDDSSGWRKKILEMEMEKKKKRKKL